MSTATKATEGHLKPAQPAQGQEDCQRARECLAMSLLAAGRPLPCETCHRFEPVAVRTAPRPARWDRED
jgi:hypothetical protein